MSKHSAHATVEGTEEYFGILGNLMGKILVPDTSQNISESNNNKDVANEDLELPKKSINSEIAPNRSISMPLPSSSVDYNDTHYKKPTLKKNTEQAISSDLKKASFNVEKPHVKESPEKSKKDVSISKRKSEESGVSDDTEVILRNDIDLKGDLNLQLLREKQQQRQSKKEQHYRGSLYSQVDEVSESPSDVFKHGKLSNSINRNSLKQERFTSLKSGGVLPSLGNRLDTLSAVGYNWAETEADVPLYTCARLFEDFKWCFKFIFAVILFFTNTISMIISKGCLLLIASQMNPYVRFSQVGLRGVDTEQCSVALCKYSSVVPSVLGVPRDSSQGSCASVESVRWIWAMFLVQCVPYFVVFCRCLKKICFSQKNAPSLTTFMGVFVLETLRTIGVFMLCHIHLPLLDVTRGLLIMSGVAFVPALLSIFNDVDIKIHKTLILDILALLAQGTALIRWLVAEPVSFHMNTDQVELLGVCSYNYTFCLEQNTSDPSSPPTVCPLPTGYRLPEIDALLTVPLALFLISMGYWENFSELSWDNGFLRTFRKRLRQSYNKTYIFISLWQIVLVWLCIFIYYYVSSPINLSMLIDMDLFKNSKERCGGFSSNVGQFHTDWMLFAAVQILMGLICYLVSHVAILSRLQNIGFTIPAAINTPVAYFVSFWICFGCNYFFKFNEWNYTSAKKWSASNNTLTDVSESFYWNCFSGHDRYVDIFIARYLWVGFVWWISSLWLVRYCWKADILQGSKLTTLFHYAMPDGALLEQSLMFSRRRDEGEILTRLENIKSREIHLTKMIMQDAHLSEGYIPTLKEDKFGTAYIYFCITMLDEKPEDLQYLLQSLFRLNSDQFARFCKKYIYNLTEPDYYEFEAHVFLDDAFTSHAPGDDNFTLSNYVKRFISSVVKAASREHNINVVLEPVVFVTPYGGRLEWVLPFGNNKLIVHLKDVTKIRGNKRWSQLMYMHSIIGRGILKQDVHDKLKRAVSKSTYILTLEGDINFEPQSFIHLIEHLKRDETIAASTGRVHPTGSGPIIWYQKFESCLQHWFIKPTEHWLGSVLTGPAQYTIFRVSALLPIIDEYTQITTTSINYIENDLGDCNRLFLLLIQSGHRVVYCAAADAYVNACEDFDNFFQEKSKDLVASHANVINLIMHARSTNEKNDHVSMIYMGFEMFYFVLSVLGPGIIFIVMVSLFGLVWNIGLFTIFIVTMIPLIGFILICFFTKPSTQLHYALILAALFAVGQVIQLAGILRVMILEGLCSIATIFVLTILGAVFLAALLHPMEIYNAIHLFFFYICIPTTYVVLMIYTVCNINHLIKNPLTHLRKKRKRGHLLRYFNIEMTDSIENMNVTSDEDDLCRQCCSWCPCYDSLRKNRTSSGSHRNSNESSEDSLNVATKQAELILKNFGPWTNEIELSNATVGAISDDEKEFWISITKHILFPFQKEQLVSIQLRIKQDLIVLRNKAAVWVFMVDFLLMIFVLSMNIAFEYRDIRDESANSTLGLAYNCQGLRYYINPIATFCILVFSVFMVANIFGMLFHRIYTLLQIVSSIKLWKPNAKATFDEYHHALKDISHEFAKDMIRVDLEANEKEGEEEDDRLSFISGIDDTTISVTTSRPKKERMTMTPAQMKAVVAARIMALKQRLDSSYIKSKQYQDKDIDEDELSTRQIFEPTIPNIGEANTNQHIGPNQVPTITSTNPSAWLIKEQSRIVDKILPD